MRLPLETVLSFSHRVFLGWEAFLDEDLDRPDRHDHYLMQLTAVIAANQSKNAKLGDPNVWGIKFEKKEVTPVTKSPDRAKLVSQTGVADVLARCGGAKVTYKTRPASEVQPW